MDAAVRRALLFALTGGQWFPPPRPTDEDMNDAPDEQVVEGSSSSLPPSPPSALGTPQLPRFSRSGLPRSPPVRRSSSIARQNTLSPDIVASSPISYLEVLQVLTLQVHTLEECASLHRDQIDLDDEAKSLSAGLSINSYLSRLIRVPESLEDEWALQPLPEGPLPSKGSGSNRGSVLGMLIALYEHRIVPGSSHASDGKAGSGSTEDTGGAWSLVADGQRWLLRFVNALVDGAPSVGAACKCATTGIPFRSSSPSAGESDFATWTIDSSIRSTILGMLESLPSLWPVQEKKPGTDDRPDKKSKEAGRAARLRAMERMRQKQSAFLTSLVTSGDTIGGGASFMDEEEAENEGDLCIICRCDDSDGEQNGPLGYLGHVQRSRASCLRATTESGEKEGLERMYRVVGDKGCQLRSSESMDSEALECLPTGSVVSVLKSKVSIKYDLLSRRVLVRHSKFDPASRTTKVVEGWASIQSSKGYIILSPLTSMCYKSSRWGSTRPIVRQCGHAAHLNCVETHTLSLHQRAAGEQPYDGRYAANIDDGEFLCPLCKQLSNILIPRDQNSTSGKPSARSMIAPQTFPDVASLRLSIRKLFLTSKSIFKDGEDSRRNALREFGTKLLRAMDVPWETIISDRKKKQKNWHPAIRRWNFEEEEGDDLDNNDSRVCVGNILRLLRQQLIAWGSIGHSALSAEASSRGVVSEQNGPQKKLSDPWSSFNSHVRDTHPMLLELRRTMTASSGLFGVLLEEMAKQLDPGTSLKGRIPVIGRCLADILDGNYWCNTVFDRKESAKLDKTLLLHWTLATRVMACLPCHVARDGMLSYRHEARSNAAAMWVVQGLGVTKDLSGADDFCGPPTPLSVAQAYQGPNGESPKDGIPALEEDWGSMKPFEEATLEDLLENNDGKLSSVFRPAVASAFLYTPLLAWDLNTLAGALFSTILSREDEDLPTDEQLMYMAQVLLIGRLVQVLVSPDGFAASSDGMHLQNWSEEELQKEAVALNALLVFLDEMKKADSVYSVTSCDLRQQSFDSGSKQILGVVSLAILPFYRSIVLMLRACSSAISQRKRRSSFRLSSDLMESVLLDPSLMTSEDGFTLLRAFGCPMPSGLVKKDQPWLGLMRKWMLSLLSFEAHQGSEAAGILNYIHNILGEGSSDSTENRAASSTQENKKLRGVSGSSWTYEFIHKNEMASAGKSDNDDVHAGAQDTELEAAEQDDDNEDMDYNGNDGDEHDDEDEAMDRSVADSSDGSDEDATIVAINPFLGGNGTVEMEIDAVDEPETFRFFNRVGLGVMLEGDDDVANNRDDGSEENDASISNGDVRRLDDDFADVSLSTIIPFQPRFLKTCFMGQGPRGSPFEYDIANSVMKDLSHLGTIHSRDPKNSCLIRLPQSFVELYSIVNRVRARDASSLEENDENTNTETAICLLTGTIMRSGPGKRTQARSQRPPGACTLHARTMGSGIAIFFLVQKCTVLLMHNNKSAYSPSLYVDEHGEEDPGLRRGRPLVLNKARYAALETLWRQQGIPREVAQIRATSDRVIRDNWY